MTDIEHRNAIEVRIDQSVGAIAELLSGQKPAPMYLQRRLNSFIFCLAIDREDCDRTRAEMVGDLRALEACINILRNLFGKRQVTLRLNGHSTDPFQMFEFNSLLGDLTKRCRRAQKDPEIVDSKGAIIRGPGRGLMHGGCSIKCWIAIHMIAMMGHCTGKRVAPRNVAACDAAELCWIACGGHPSGSGARDSWRRHFQKAYDQKGKRSIQDLRSQMSWLEAVTASCSGQ